MVPLRTGSDVVKPDSGFLSSKFLLVIRAVLGFQPPQNAPVSHERYMAGARNQGTAWRAGARRDASFSGAAVSGQRSSACAAAGSALAVPAMPAYFLRNLSTRPAVSTIFCLPV